MLIDRAAARARLASSMVLLLGQGVWVEDFIEALRTAVRQRALQAQAEPMPARRAELALFYADTDQILAGISRRLEVAGRSAKNIARRR